MSVTTHLAPPFARLRQITKEQGLKKVADALGISPQALIRFLKGQYLPPRVARKAEELYGIPALETVSPKYRKFLEEIGRDALERYLMSETSSPHSGEESLKRTED